MIIKIALGIVVGFVVVAIAGLLLRSALLKDQKDAEKGAAPNEKGRKECESAPGSGGDVS